MKILMLVEDKRQITPLAKPPKIFSYVAIVLQTA